MKSFLKNKKIIFSGIFFAIVFAVFFILPANHAQAVANLFTGATDNYWGEPTNWSQGTIPTATDGYVTTFNATSPNCTVNTSTRYANAINFTGYTNTITMTNGIYVYGNITLEGTMGISGTGALVAAGTGTLTSDAKTWPNAFYFSGTSLIYTLADDWDIDGTIYLQNTTAGTINGQTIYAGGSLSSTTNASSSGTTNFILNGTGTWSGGNLRYFLFNLTINTAGTITVSGTLSYGGGTGKTLTYTAAGTMIVAGSTMIMGTGTYNTSGMTWNNISMINGNQTLTLLSDLNCVNYNSIITTYTNTINGAFNINVSGNINLNTQTSGVTAGTATFVMTGTSGTATLSMTSATTGGLTNPLTFAAGANTITVGSFRYSTGTLTHTSGTMSMGTSTLTIGAAATTFNTSGMTWNNVTFNAASVTHVLLSDLNIGGNTIFTLTTSVLLINGAFNINCGGNVTFNNTTAYLGGTATIVMTGTGTLSMPLVTTGYFVNNLIFAAGANTITISGNIRYKTGTLTYTSGTITVTGSTLTLTGDTTLALNNLTLNNLSITGTTTVITLTSGFQISGAITNGSSASHMTIKSSVADTQRTLTLLAGATQDLNLVDATDIDSSAGQTIRTYKGVLDNATNWVSTLGGLQTVAYTFVF